MKAEFAHLIKTAEGKINMEKEAFWIDNECEKLGLPMIKRLAKSAVAAREFSYCPYSNYPVGAAILSVSGKIGEGANIEVATFSETGHAEEMAAKRLILEGEILRNGRRFIQAVAVCHEGNSAPCGRCRQVLTEFCDNCLVIMADHGGKIREITSLKALMPSAFCPTSLGYD